MGSVPPMGKFLDPFNGFYRNAEAPDSHFQEEELALEGLRDAVLIRYDEFMVPHIEARNNHDLYFTQGYITARFRLWQMEVQTHFAAGRLTEIFGEPMLERDRFTRRIGLPYGAERALAAMEQDPFVKEVLHAYSDGINAYISSLHYHEIPFEYKLLDYKPEAWSPLKSALLLKYMANDLAGRDYDLENTNLVQLFGKETFNLLFPERLTETDPVIPKGTRWNFQPQDIQVPSPAIKLPQTLTSQTLPRPEKDNGSNNWAVSPQKTKNGNAILANDPHLSLNLPSIWYALQLSNQEANTYGVSLPGAPGIVIGFNDSIAWGMTNATRDVRDWYAISFRDEQRMEYAYEGEWRQTRQEIERFRLRAPNFWNRGKTVRDTILFTHHGPVVYDQHYLGDTTRQNYALRWTAHDPSNELKALLLLNRARNYNDYQQAITHYQTPAQNFVFASIAGDIALWVQGKFPARWKEQGKFLMDGSSPATEWQDFIPQPHNAHTVNPERGFVSSANQMPVDSTYPYYTYDQNYQHYRNRRINQELARMNNITAEDMMRLQNDNYNLKAAETLPWMLDSLRTAGFTAGQQEVFDQLVAWNYEQEARKTAPAIYDMWWQEFRKLLWDELDSVHVSIIRPGDANTIALLRKNPKNHFVDIQLTPRTETLGDLLNESFDLAIEKLEEWQEEQDPEQELNWGTYKNSSIRHLTQQDALSATNLQIDGGRDIVNANSGRHGPSWRMVVELSQPPTGYGIYPGGQSGNPGSPYYDNFVENWQQGAYKPLYFINSQQEFRDKILFSQTLKPKK